jgi:hypothetical protein
MNHRNCLNINISHIMNKYRLLILFYYMGKFYLENLFGKFAENL